MVFLKRFKVLFSILFLFMKNHKLALVTASLLVSLFLIFQNAIGLNALLSGSTAPLSFTADCPSVLEGTCLAQYTGGLLTGPLSIPYAMDPTDASAFRVGDFSPTAIDLKGAIPTVEGIFAGGPTGTPADAGVNLNSQNLRPVNSFDIPSGGKPSPLFGAKPFTQDMFLFEEFGPEKLAASASQNTLPLPKAATLPNNIELDVIDTKSAPLGSELEAFLGEPGLYPYPTRLSNTTMPNPWWNKICSFLGRTNCADAGPMEGRPPGEGWSHQRWQEFFPEKAYKTAQTGARQNLGLRDKKQMHQFKVGEFGPGGLYYRAGANSGTKVQLHPNFPVQDHNSVWTFDGTMPPKLLMARYGEPVLMRHFNALPIDVSANKGFGSHTISTHGHNGHNPAESDGFAGAFFFPGQYYDYRWPITLAGTDTINNNATDFRAGTPCAAGETLRVSRKSGPTLVTCDVSRDPLGKNGTVNLRGDYRETESTLWFHDHMLDFTSQNVYKGNGAMMNFYSAVDRGNESVNDGVNLRLPSGSALSWGNRDYDVNLLIADKAWDSKGQLWFNIFNREGMLGDQMTVNWAYKPKLEVRARKYRFRILNGAVGRYFKLALVKEVKGISGEMQGPVGSNLSYNRVPFYLIANDGNIMEHSVAFDGTLGTEKGVLPTQAIGERYDIIVDFAKNSIKPGDKVYFVNLLEHKTGQRPEKTIPLAEVLSETYKALPQPDQYLNGDPTVGKFLQFSVNACKNAAGASIVCADQSIDPSLYIAGKKAMLLAPTFTAQELATARHRSFSFGKGGGTTDDAPYVVKTDGGQSYSADPRRISAAPNLGNLNPDGMAQVEIWHIDGGVGGWSHPVHMHFEEGKMLNRDGLPVPEWEKWARKDIFRIGHEDNSSSKIDIAYRWREFSGTYVEHCHNTTHEDHAMLVRWDLEKPGQLLLMPTPVPEWDGVHYVDSVAEKTFRTGTAQ